MLQALIPLLKKAVATAGPTPDYPFGKAIIANMSSLMGSVADNKSGGRYGYRMTKVHVVQNNLR